MEISICSFSFHRLLAAGKQDIFKYITDCKELGATQLEPWIAHFGTGRNWQPSLETGADPEDVWSVLGALMRQPPPVVRDDPAHASIQDADYLDRVKAAAVQAGLPFGGIAVDGAHIYEPTPEARQANRAFAYQWLDIAEKLGARQVRIDAGGPEEVPDDVFQIIVEGYQDLVARGREKGLEILMENHWGSSRIPENVVRIMEAVEGLGLLLDTGNWPAGMQEKGWRMCAKYARATHIKTFGFDAEGNELSADIPKAMNILMDAGYDGCWGIESCPKDGDEYEGARKTIALIRRVLSQ